MEIRYFRKNDNQKGVSLLGVIIATFIVAVGLIAILSLANKTLKSSTTSKMRLIASGLAQEGIEIVRETRKSYPEWADWYSGIFGTTIYRPQYNSECLICCPNPVSPCPGSNTPLRLETSSGLYQYNYGNNSPFYREVTLTKISDDEVEVIVEVKWQTKGEWHYLIAEDRLWNWK